MGYIKLKRRFICIPVVAMAAQNQPDGYLFKLRDESDRARAEFERIQLDAQTARASAVALNNGCTDDLFADLFQNAPKFAPGPFDVKCALLIVRGEDNQWKVDSRLSGANDKTFPGRIIVGKYHAVIGNVAQHASNPLGYLNTIVKSIGGIVGGQCPCYVNQAGMYAVNTVVLSGTKIITTFICGRTITSDESSTNILKLIKTKTAD